jgi:predicted nucleotidyltransferase
MRRHGIDIPMDRVEAFCRANRIRRLALFGSILREDFGPQSDREFEPGATPGLEFFRMQRELGQIMGRRVDMNTPQELSRYFRDQVLDEAQVLYASACR